MSFSGAVGRGGHDALRGIHGMANCVPGSTDGGRSTASLYARAICARASRWSLAWIVKCLVRVLPGPS
ncbi:MAG: hypothetical protein EPO40_08410 [Myxococcaceae bacterium]|nr:MAG: hypothetical protein EPO40_08410 [Myxococcaceae bacterium]